MTARLILPASIILATFTSPVFAQQEAPAIDMEARRQSVVNLGRHITQREKRLEEVRTDIRALDKRIEGRTDELIKMLTEISDSQESKTRVAQLKMRAIEGLRRWIRIYQDRRGQIVESLKREGEHLPKEQLAEEIDAFDKRVDKRVAQILELTASMGEHQDVKKYESDSESYSYRSGYYHESSRVSEDWRQNRRETTMTDKNRKELIDAVKAAIERLESRRASLDDTIKNRKLSASEKEIQLEELGRVDASIERRRRELKDLATAKGSASGQPLGRNKAHDVEQLLEDAGEDLSDDFQRLLRMYDEFDKERNKTHKLRENLKAREVWLQENDK